MLFRLDRSDRVDLVLEQAYRCWRTKCIAKTQQKITDAACRFLKVVPF